MGIKTKNNHRGNVIKSKQVVLRNNVLPKRDKSLDSNLTNNLKALRLASLTGEVWKSVYGSNGEYFVSTLGRVASVRYYSTTGLTVKVLESRLAKNGYKYVHIPFFGTVKKMFVHDIVSSAWLKGEKVTHKNGRKDDNCVTNLVKA